LTFDFLMRGHNKGSRLRAFVLNHFREIIQLSELLL